MINNKLLIEKIAKSISSTSESSSINTVKTSTKHNPKAVTGIKTYSRNSRNLQGTIHKARSNADVQPLHQDEGIIGKPMDSDTQQVVAESTTDLSHLEDRRLSHLPIRKTLR